MSKIFTARLPTPSPGEARLKRMIWRSQACGGPSIRLRLELLYSSTGDVPFAQRLSRIGGFIQLTEEADDILFVFSEAQPDGASRAIHASRSCSWSAR